MRENTNDIPESISPMLNKPEIAIIGKTGLKSIITPINNESIPEINIGSQLCGLIFLI